MRQRRPAAMGTIIVTFIGAAAEVFLIGEAAKLLAVLPVRENFFYTNAGQPRVCARNSYIL
jgi:hypothetical protein